MKVVPAAHVIQGINISQRALERKLVIAVQRGYWIGVTRVGCGLRKYIYVCIYLAWKRYSKNKQK